ncbi:hypothetical protein CNR22_01790 [Sphingobacteriaceae bacterium]|nr:hypothetical protein CNR22_01790 [Sphingobacteriaceae bacterium]
MKVSEIMTSRALKYCTTDTKLRKAAKLMKAGNCGALPVVDENKKVLGIITDRDICLSMAKKHGKADAKRTVSQIMPKDIYTVKTDDSVATAFRQMRMFQVGRLPVTNANGMLKGIVSLHSVINHSMDSGTKSVGASVSASENLLKTLQAVNKRYAPNKSTKKTVKPTARKN